jgi:hypothetical protein
VALAVIEALMHMIFRHTFVTAADTVAVLGISPKFLLQLPAVLGMIPRVHPTPKEGDSFMYEDKNDEESDKSVYQKTPPLRVTNPPP